MKVVGEDAGFLAERKWVGTKSQLLVKLSARWYVYNRRSNGGYRRENFSSAIFNYARESHGAAVKDRCHPLNGSKNWKGESNNFLFAILRKSQPFIPLLAFFRSLAKFIIALTVMIIPPLKPPLNQIWKLSLSNIKTTKTYYFPKNSYLLLTLAPMGMMSSLRGTKEPIDLCAWSIGPFIEKFNWICTTSFYFWKFLTVVH